MSKRTGPKPHHWSHWVSPEPNSGCWLWDGDADGQSGRAMLTRHVEGKRRRLTVARIVWEDVKGPIPPDKWVLHRCNNKACVNPDHLYLGTHKENMQDMARSGIKKRVYRTHCPRGHLYDLQYSYSYQNILQVCSTCNREKCRAYYVRKAERVAA